MKKLLAILLTAMLAIGCLAGCGSSGKSGGSGSSPDPVPEGSLIDIEDYLTEKPEDATPQEIYDLCMIDYNFIYSIAPLFDEDSITTYYSYIVQLKRNLTEEYAAAAKDAYKALVQNDAVADRVVFLWGDNIPWADGETPDPSNIGPILIKYMADDPSAALGNIVLHSGGTGENTGEAFPAAEAFQELGYNCYVFYRRENTSDEDHEIDLQRAFKYARYMAKTENYGGQNMLATIGFSAGGLENMYVLTDLLGTDNATKYDTDYVCDDIDAVNSCCDVFCNIYGGPMEPLSSDLPNMPALYLCAGSEDETGACERLEAMYEQFKDIVPCELRIMEGAGHGFGAGQEGATLSTDECKEWMQQASDFMQANLGFQSTRYGLAE